MSYDQKFYSFLKTGGKLNFVIYFLDVKKFLTNYKNNHFKFKPIYLLSTVTMMFNCY